MIKTVACDKCLKEMPAGMAHHDHDGRHYCDIHMIEIQLSEARTERSNKATWLERTHLQELRKMDARIADLELQWNAAKRRMGDVS